MLTTPKLHNSTKIKIKVMVKVLPPSFYVCYNTNLKPMFCKQIIHLQNQGTSKRMYNLKKFNNYMTRLPLGIQEMNNNHKSIHTPLKHSKIKTSFASTWVKGWRYKLPPSLFYHPRKNIISQLLLWWKIKASI